MDETAEPACGPDDVLIKVAAAGINRADLLQRDGKYPPPPGASAILGLEAAGVISAVGSDVGGWKPGDKVCALLAGGGYAAAAACPHQMLLPVPDGWSMIQAAAFPEAYFTAYLNLLIEGALRHGETVLIHGGASGVGTAAIQVAKIFGGTVIATAGSDQKTSACLSLGADIAINYKTQDFAAVIEEKLGRKPVDLILDPVGGSHLPKNIRLLKSGGRLVLIAVMGGAEASLDLAAMLRGRLTIKGSTLRNRPLAEKIELHNRLYADLWPQIAAGKLAPVIDAVFPAAEAQKAHDRMEGNHNTGKIVLTFG